MGVSAHLNGHRHLSVTGRALALESTEDVSAVPDSSFSQFTLISTNSLKQRILSSLPRNHGSVPTAWPTTPCSSLLWNRIAPVYKTHLEPPVPYDLCFAISHCVMRKGGMDVKAGDIEASKASSVQDEGTPPYVECIAEVAWLPTVPCVVLGSGGFFNYPQCKTLKGAMIRVWSSNCSSLSWDFPVFSGSRCLCGLSY